MEYKEKVRYYLITLWAKKLSPQGYWTPESLRATAEQKARNSVELYSQILTLIWLLGIADVYCIDAAKRKIS